MSRQAVIALADDRFRIDFARLRGARDGVVGWLRSIADPRPISLDPALVAHALRAVMVRCQTRSAVDERLILWNEFWVVLAGDDHERLQPLLRRLEAELDTVIRRSVAELDAELLADPVVRIVVDEEHRTPRGTAEIRAAHNDRARAAPSRDGEMTVRLGDVRRDEERHPTQPVREPAADGDLALTWGEGLEAFLPLGNRVQLGRPHDSAPQRFIALHGASRRINKRQLAIENAAERVIVTRLAHANPVQVEGHLIQPGGKLTVDRLPVTVSLSSGDLDLELRRIAGR